MYSDRSLSRSGYIPVNQLTFMRMYFWPNWLVSLLAPCTHHRPCTTTAILRATLIRATTTKLFETKLCVGRTRILFLDTATKRRTKAAPLILRRATMHKGGIHYEISFRLSFHHLTLFHQAFASSSLRSVSGMAKHSRSHLRSTENRTRVRALY